MEKTIAALALGISVLSVQDAVAATCGGIYTVQSGDSLSVIADKLYKDAGKWTVIHNRNIASIAPKPNATGMGMKLDLTCFDGLPVGLEGGVKLQIQFRQLLNLGKPKQEMRRFATNSTFSPAVIIGHSRI